jgi:hypothetical protein
MILPSTFKLPVKFMSNVVSPNLSIAPYDVVNKLLNGAIGF